MVDRAIERTGSEASILAQINDPSADEAVRLFAVADADYSGAPTLPEFTSALTAASEATYSEAGVTRLIGARGGAFMVRVARSRAPWLC